MKKNLFILFILVSMLFPGCENELPYMNKPQVPQLLMNAFLEAGKEENGVSLRMIDTDKQQADCVSNGSIVVYVNGQKTETAEVEKVYGSFDDSNCTLKTSFRPGDRIRFEATAEDGQYQAGCEVEIPFPIEETIRVDILDRKRDFHLATSLVLPVFGCRFKADTVTRTKRCFQRAIRIIERTIDLLHLCRLGLLPVDIYYNGTIGNTIRLLFIGIDHTQRHSVFFLSGFISKAPRF